MENGIKKRIERGIARSAAALGLVGCLSGCPSEYGNRVINAAGEQMIYSAVDQAVRNDLDKSQGVNRGVTVNNYSGENRYVERRGITLGPKTTRIYNMDTGNVEAETDGWYS
jgi:hypothetical protein